MAGESPAISTDDFASIYGTPPPVAPKAPTPPPAPTPDFSSIYGTPPPEPRPSPSQFDAIYRYPSAPASAQALADTPPPVDVGTGPTPPKIKLLSDEEMKQTLDDAQRAVEAENAAKGVPTKTPAEQPEIALPRMGTMGTETSLMNLNVPKTPQWVNNAIEAAGETAIGFVPKTPKEVAAFLVPEVGASDEVKNTYGMMQQFIQGKPFGEAHDASFPESLILKNADKTPPLSKERFAAAFNVLAQMGVAGTIAHQIKGGEPNASGITSTASTAERQVRPRVGEETPLRQQGETAGARPGIAGQPTEEPIQAAETPDDVISQPETGGGGIQSVAAGSAESAATVPTFEHPHGEGRARVRVMGQEYRGPTTEHALETARKHWAPDMSLAEFLDELEFGDPTYAPDLNAEEKAAAAHEQEQKTEFEDVSAAQGPELLDAIKGAGGLASHASGKAPEFRGELKFLTEMSKGGAGAKGHFSGSLFKRTGLEPDMMVQALAEQGFDFQDASDLFNALDQRFRDGKPIHGNRALAGNVFGFGPGAAAKGEIDLSMAGREPLSIKNEDIDAARRAKGKEGLMSMARQSNPVLWDRAMDMLDRTPLAAQNLVDAIREGKVKTTSDLEQAMLLHEYIRLQNEKTMTAERAVDPNATAEERSNAATQFDALEARVDATERAARTSGTIAGRALQARQLAAFDDYTYAGIETRSRNAKGRPLTLDESEKIKAQAEEIERLQGELEKAQDAGSRDRAMETLGNIIRENLKSAKAEARGGKSVVDILHSSRDAALERIKARRGTLYAGIDPGALLDEVIVGASHIADGLVEFGAWSQKMISDLGDKIEPYLRGIYDRAKEYYDAHAKAVKPKKAKPTAMEKIQAAAEAEAAGEGEGLTNRMVFERAREHVQAGVEGLDAVMAAVHKDLEPHFPGLTVREVRDAFSDYGKVRFPSKEADLAALRDYRRQAQLVSALEDAKEGLSPKKTGAQRDQPSATVLDLQKQVQDAMRESGITTASDPSRLKTNLDRYKTLLDNKITDAQRRLAEKDYAKPTRRATVLDKEATAKKAELQGYQRKIDLEIERERLKNRTFWEKAQDAMVHWARIAKLASPRIFPKLVEAGMLRIVTNPIHRLLVQPLRLIPGLTEKAPARLDMSFRAEAARVSGILTAGPEALRKLVGRSKLDALGKKRLLDAEMFNFVGNAHGMIKEPVRQGEFRAAVQYYTDAALRQGLDIREPAVQAQIVSDSVAQANDQIFMGENPFSKFYVSMVVNGLRNAKFTGAKSLANATQFVMPIVKVSSNIAVAQARLAAGLPESFLRIGTALKRGELADSSAKLSPEDANALARSFGGGMLGLILAAYAWQNPDKFGGIYGEYDETHKKGPAGLKTNEIQLPGGFKLPGWMNHAPEAWFLNMVASSRRVYDKNYAKMGAGNAMMETLAFSLMAPVKNMPFIDAWLRYFSGHQSAGRTMGQTVRSAILPGGDSILQMFDSQERRPQTFTDELKMGIPGLRQTVPVKSAGGSSRAAVPQMSGLVRPHKPRQR